MVYNRVELRGCKGGPAFTRVLVGEVVGTSVGSFRVVTPMNSHRSLTTTVRTNTSSVCFKVRDLGVHTHSTDAFAIGSLHRVTRVYSGRNVGDCLAVGAVVCSRSVTLVHAVISTTGRTNVDTIVTTSITMVTCYYRIKRRMRLSARLGVDGTKTLGFCTHFTSMIMLTHRLGLGRIQIVCSAVRGRRVGNPGKRLIHVRVFYRKTLYVTISNGYCLDLRRVGTSTGQKTYVRVYHHTCSIGSGRDSVRLRISGGCVVSPGSLGAVRFVSRVVRTNIHIFGVRKHTQKPRCMHAIIRYCGRTVYSCLRNAFARRGGRT